MSIDDLAAACRDVGQGLILVVTGAGVSLASGIPTFRGTDPEAIWKSRSKYDGSSSSPERKRRRGVPGAGSTASNSAARAIRLTQRAWIWRTR